MFSIASGDNGEVYIFSIVHIKNVYFVIPFESLSPFWLLWKLNTA